jgi:hypothetical protein
MTMTPREFHLAPDLQDQLINLIVRRANEARAAIGLPAIHRRALIRRCIPNHCRQCAMGSALQPRSIQLTEDAMWCETPEQASAIATAWKTATFGESSREPDGGDVWVKLPSDLTVATRAFDAGQLPQLRNPNVEFIPTSELRDECVSKAAARAAVEPVR